jgi:hypothetical protein
MSPEEIRELVRADERRQRLEIESTRLAIKAQADEEQRFIKEAIAASKREEQWDKEWIKNHFVPDPDIIAERDAWIEAELPAIEDEYRKHYEATREARTGTERRDAEIESLKRQLDQVRKCLDEARVEKEASERRARKLESALSDTRSHIERLTSTQASDLEEVHLMYQSEILALQNEKNELIDQVESWRDLDQSRVLTHCYRFEQSVFWLHHQKVGASSEAETLFTCIGDLRATNSISRIELG